MQHAVGAFFIEEIAVAVAEESARAGAFSEEAFILLVTWGHFEWTNCALHVAQAHVFGPEFGRDSNGQAGGEGVLNHLPVDPFGVEIDFDAPPTARNSIEKRLPKIVAALSNPAFPVDAKRDSVDGRHCFEQRSQSVATVRCMIVG